MNISGTTRQPIEEAIAAFDREAHAGAMQRHSEQRAALIERFPIERWPEMRIEEYALGQENSEETYCRWLEFRTPDVGSIRGGSAAKLVIYKHKDKPGWHFPRMFDDVETAWEHLRADFVRLLELGGAGRWEEMDDFETLGWGPAIRGKTVHVYFPDETLPIYSFDHLRHFMRRLGRPDEEASGYRVVETNRNLLATLREVPQLAEWSPKELQLLLYEWADPRSAKRVVKIAPGEKAKFWDECFAGGYICVGWDDVGDLMQFESKDAFRARFGELHPYNGHKPSVTRKSNELWTLRELEPGDLVVANQGTSKVLAVGEVVEPGYAYREDRSEMKHTVAIDWDTRFARSIPPQKDWALVTVKKVPEALFEQIVSDSPAPTPAVVGPPKPRPAFPVDPFYPEIAASLERKGQVVLYGPPGTGKTYHARRFAVWWLLKQSGEEDAPYVLGDSPLMAAREKNLSEPEAGMGGFGVGRLTRVTFHPSYTYEDFIEGFRPVDVGGQGGLALRLEDGIFKRVCCAATADPDRPYLLLVDEINRGNVAKILGELLTLLEVDKRGLTVSLPQSKERFAIPPNVYILGTMNTADRSIKLLDAALRRRFAFIELMPDVEILRGASAGDLALDEFLEELNRRIAHAEGREKQIGHAYLLTGGDPISEVEDLARCFREDILPLLQEYCYDDYGVLARFIGDALVDAEAQMLAQETVADAESLVSALAVEFSGGSEGVE